MPSPAPCVETTGLSEAAVASATLSAVQLQDVSIPSKGVLAAAVVDFAACSSGLLWPALVVVDAGLGIRIQLFVGSGMSVVRACERSATHASADVLSALRPLRTPCRYFLRASLRWAGDDGVNRMRLYVRQPAMQQVLQVALHVLRVTQRCLGQWLESRGTMSCQIAPRWVQSRCCAGAVLA